jgi:hypothetical protein
MIIREMMMDGDKLNIEDYLQMIITCG